MVDGRFGQVEEAEQILPGLPRDYLGTTVELPAHASLLAEPGVQAALHADTAPIPTTEAREGYYGDRHLEYWLSGLHDARAILARAECAKPIERVLDFGGASGRIARHFVQLLPDAEVVLSDINPKHINFVNAAFAPRIMGVHNHGTSPHLPFESNHFDLVAAFSVFTHLSTQSIAWLLEMKRILKPGGTLYATVHDDETWKILGNHWLGNICFSNEDFAAYYKAHGILQNPVVHYYSDNEDYNCNIFLTAEYIRRVWGGVFEVGEIIPMAHSHQAAVLLRKR